MAGEYIERRIVGMAMAEPALAVEYADLDTMMASDDNRRAYRAIRELGSDILLLRERLSLEMVEYLIDAALDLSFCPELFPAYVRVLREIDGERAYAQSVRRLRSQRPSDDPFRAI